MEPRIIEYQEVQKSLVYHIDMAQAIGHDLAYLIKYMRSAAEVKRIQRERQLMKEFEAQEEARRIAFLKAAEEMKDFHAAATQINLLYRISKAKRIVSDRRIQLKLENAMLEERVYLNAVVTVQKTIRMASTRHWLFSFGFEFDRSLVKRNGMRKVKKKKLVDVSVKKAKRKMALFTAEVKHERIERDLRLRVVQVRQAIMQELEKKHAAVRQVLYIHTV